VPKNVIGKPTGKTTQAGYPIYQNTSVPSPPHTSDATPGQEHVDVQSFNTKGKASNASKHHTEPGMVSWGRQAHGKGKK
jgi:hypothetical protein